MNLCDMVTSILEDLPDDLLCTEEIDADLSLRLYAIEGRSAYINVQSKDRGCIGSLPASIDSKPKLIKDIGEERIRSALRRLTKQIIKKVEGEIELLEIRTNHFVAKKKSLEAIAPDVAIPEHIEKMIRSILSDFEPDSEIKQALDSETFLVAWATEPCPDGMISIVTKSGPFYLYPMPTDERVSFLDWNKIELALRNVAKEAALLLENSKTEAAVQLRRSSDRIERLLKISGEI